MESTHSSVNLTHRKQFTKKLETLLIAVLFLWTPVLMGLTFKYQTSCPGPLLTWSEQSKQLSKDCQSELDNHQVTKNSNQEPVELDNHQVTKNSNQEPVEFGNHQVTKNSSQEPDSKDKDGKDKPGPLNPDIVGLVVGTAAGGALAAFSAPVTAVAGAAVAVWFIIRTILLNS